MDIKEIALRISEKADEYADAKLQSKGEFHPDWHTVRDEYFAEALISSYKAELLKEVGEPKCWMTPDGEGWRMRTKPPEINTKLGWIEFYTSDQVAAAILKATKPLEDQLAKAEQRVAAYQEARRAAAQFEAELARQRDLAVEALTKCSEQLTRLGYSANHADKALSTIKESEEN